jgi:hypothetical protein
MKPSGATIQKVLMTTNLVREGMICEEGHFHPVVSFAEGMLSIAAMATLIEDAEAWPDADLREVAYSTMAQMAQSLREDLDPDVPMTTQQVAKRLELDNEDLLPLVALMIGLKGVMPENTVVH